jgi:hypothetical protein
MLHRVHPLDVTGIDRGRARSCSAAGRRHPAGRPVLPPAIAEADGGRKRGVVYAPHSARGAIGVGRRRTPRRPRAVRDVGDAVRPHGAVRTSPRATGSPARRTARGRPHALKRFEHLSGSAAGRSPGHPPDETGGIVSPLRRTDAIASRRPRPAARRDKGFTKLRGHAIGSRRRWRVDLRRRHPVDRGVDGTTWPRNRYGSTSAGPGRTPQDLRPVSERLRRRDWLELVFSGRQL